MAMDLRDKLKHAKRKRELNEIKRIIGSATNIAEESFVLTDVSYQEIVDQVYGKLILIRDEHDFSSQFVFFKNFLDMLHKDEELIVYIRTTENTFFITIPTNIIKRNPELFWHADELMGVSRERIVINNNMSKGIVMLDSEYGIEWCIWK